MASRAPHIITRLLAKADIQVNGDRPWDIRVHNARFFLRVFLGGSLALGESYMDGWWDAQQLDETIARILHARLERAVRSPGALLAGVAARLHNAQSHSRAFIIGERHYDIGNDLYTAMLDPRMAYSCGYWKDVTTLAQAQDAKLDLVCRKLGLQRGQRVLDIGCGWGSFARFAVERYGVSVVGVTVSKEQLAFARERCAGLPVELRLEDYRNLRERFDHIVSLGMFEHVGVKNYQTFMRVAARCLRDDGLFLLHTIGGNRSVHSMDPWIGTYIFPNSMLPSITQIGRSIEGLFVMEDWHNFSADYEKTLLTWWDNVARAWPTLRERYGERFYRMWRYYLLACAGSFRTRHNQLWQIVLSARGVRGGYTSVR